MSISKNIHYIILLFTCICTVIICIRKIKSNIKDKFYYDKFVMKIPVYNKIMTKNIIIRF